MINRAIKILLFDIHMKDVRAGENQTRRMKKDIHIIFICLALDGRVNWELRSMEIPLWKRASGVLSSIRDRGDGFDCKGGIGVEPAKKTAEVMSYTKLEGKMTLFLCE